MPQYAGGASRQALRVLVLHDDPERESHYGRRREGAGARPGSSAWTIFSIENDWATVFDEAPPGSR
jgi:hypothetical protein